MRRERPPLSVYITIDTEAWPRGSEWREDHLNADIQRDIYGETKEGAVGLKYQLDLFKTQDLRAIFFVEALHTLAVGTSHLQEMIRIIQEYGQDVQAHPHPEWLQWISDKDLPPFKGPNLHDYTVPEQAQIVAKVAGILTECGAKSVRSMRAGNFGASPDTLRALATIGMPIDFSMNLCAPDGRWSRENAPSACQPVQMEGVIEYPVSFFEDYPGHWRHAQVCACSASELTRALERAYENGWSHFVIVFHTFELLKNRKVAGAIPRINGTVKRRFESLCRFLSDNRDRFQTEWTPEAEWKAPSGTPAPIHGDVWLTFGRYVEQAWNRLT